MNSTPRAKSTREDRAAAILAAGLVTLLPGTGRAVVKGSGKAQYVVTRDGCNCPDRTRRNLPCKHEIAVKSLCGLYRACQQQAKETGRVRLPWVLSLALRGGTTSPVPASVAVPVLTCGDCGVTIQRGRTCTDCLDKALGFSVAA